MWSCVPKLMLVSTMLLGISFRVICSLWLLVTCLLLHCVYHRHLGVFKAGKSPARLLDSGFLHTVD